jgi:hypothetical protein
MLEHSNFIGRPLQKKMSNFIHFNQFFCLPIQARQLAPAVGRISPPPEYF